MSAILAIFNRNGAQVDPSELERMMSASPERGRDGSNIWTDGPIALANQYFWTTPEEEGELQPLHDAGGNQVISCDARLDNRVELATFFKISPGELSKTTDAELVLIAYQKWGVNCPAWLLGDFAFAIWDKQKQTLFIARDIFGNRDLAYFADQQRCLIASQITQILAYPAMQRRLNEAMIAEWLAILWDNQEETFYQDIYYCPPGYSIQFTKDTIKKEQYWEVDPSKKIRYPNDQEYADHYLELLIRAVGDRLRCTGLVGISMSGGLDSTSLAAISSHLLPESGLNQTYLPSFSYTFDRLTECDEREYIQPVVDEFGLEATYLPCDDLWPLKDLNTWPQERDYPWCDTYALLPAVVMQAAAKRGCRLLLAGYYGDVLFTGDAYWALGPIQELRLFELTKILRNSPTPVPFKRDLFDYGLRALVPQQIKRSYRRIRPRQDDELFPGLNPDFIQRTQLRERAERANHYLSEKYSAPGQLARYRALMNVSFAQGASTTRPVYNRHGLELATPYQDRRLVEFVMAIPTDQLGRPGRDRWVHRNALQGLLPPIVCERTRKTTFGILDKIGLENERQNILKILSNPQIISRNILSSDWLQNELNLCYNNNQESGYLWTCILLELWLQSYW